MKCNRTFDDRLARSVTTKEEAGQCLIDFIFEGIGNNDAHRIVKHSHGYDLYLPWFIEVIEYRPPYPDREVLPIPELQMLYMDAAWELVMKGVIRPGPKTIGGEVDRDAYGKAYSLVKGMIH